MSRVAKDRIPRAAGCRTTRLTFSPYWRTTTAPAGGREPGQQHRRRHGGESPQFRPYSRVTLSCTIFFCTDDEKPARFLAKVSREFGQMQSGCG